MIQLLNNELVLSSPEVHSKAEMRISFQRTLRIPDDGRVYPLPPGLNRFPLRHVDDCADSIPKQWLTHGGVMFPMYQSEAMWILFDGDYPHAVKIATGKINAVNGKAWKDGLTRTPQDYVVVPGQPWLDGYCVEKGMIRQFVAMPLGAGYSAEEQLTGEAEYGGLQIMACPMKREAYEEYVRAEKFRPTFQEDWVCYSPPLTCEMGLAPGGRMKQAIYEDSHRPSDWDTEHFSRCFVHICNSMSWQDITGKPAPTIPPTAAEYSKAGLPWFEYYSENLEALGGSKRLHKLKSVVELGGLKKGALPENKSSSPKRLIKLHQGRRPEQVREWKG